MSTAVIVPISMPKSMAQIIDRMAANAMMTRSEYVRYQIRKNTSQQALNELRKVAVPAAKRAGIYDENDVVRLINADRKQRNRASHD